MSAGPRVCVVSMTGLQQRGTLVGKWLDVDGDVLRLRERVRAAMARSPWPDPGAVTHLGLRRICQSSSGGERVARGVCTDEHCTRRRQAVAGVTRPSIVK